jgi:outer membrane protein OmpA-like peptidoglycan-associated protein
MIKNILIFVFVFFNLKSIAQQKYVVYFDFNKDIPNANVSKDFVYWLKNNHNIEAYRIDGFCDSVNNQKYNIDLANRRIKNVLLNLQKSKVKISNSIQLSPLGEDFELSSNQAENRKVIFYYKISDKSLKNNIENSKIGEKLKLENLNFYNFSDVVVPKSEIVLQNLLNIMVERQSLIIQIQGHICCVKVDKANIAYLRAKKVYDFLIKNGIDKSRLSFKSFGSAQPIYPLPEKNNEEEDENRRVEILVLSK